MPRARGTGGSPHPNLRHTGRWQLSGGWRGALTGLKIFLNLALGHQPKTTREAGEEWASSSRAPLGSYALLCNFSRKKKICSEGGRGRLFITQKDHSYCHFQWIHVISNHSVGSPKWISQIELVSSWWKDLVIFPEEKNMSVCNLLTLLLFPPLTLTLDNYLFCSLIS